MNNMPSKLKKDIFNDNWYLKCCRVDDKANCSGRMTKEHALYYAGSQVQEKWAIISLCWYHHLGFGLNKEYNQWVALYRLFNNKEWLKDAKKNYKKAIPSWEQKLKYLNKIYGGNTKKIFED